MTAHRLAAHKLLPAVLAILLLGDFAVGLNWLLAPASSLTSRVYDTAKRIMPMHCYGLLFVVLAALTVAVVLERRRSLVSGVLVGLVFGGAWAFWAVLFLLVPLGRPGSSYFGAIIAGLVLMPLHLLAGLVLTRPPVAVGDAVERD